MAFSKSKFLTLFLLFSSLHLGFASEEVVDDPIAQTQSEIVGEQLPYAECSNCGHTGNCVISPTCCSSGNYCNPPCMQNGCGCMQNPSNRCCSGPGCQPSPTCPWQGPCPSCGCVEKQCEGWGRA